MNGHHRSSRASAAVPMVPGVHSTTEVSQQEAQGMHFPSWSTQHTGPGRQAKRHPTFLTFPVFCETGFSGRAGEGSLVLEHSSPMMLDTGPVAFLWCTLGFPRQVRVERSSLPLIMSCPLPLLHRSCCSPGKSSPKLGHRPAVLCGRGRAHL